LDVDPAPLYAEVLAKQDRIQRVHGSARVRVESRALKGSVDQFIAAEKPDRLHIEVLDFFGNPAVVLIADGNKFLLYDARANVVYRGAPTAENLGRLLPIALPPRDLVGALCGSPPLLPGAEPIQAQTQGETTTLLVRAGDRQEVFTLADRGQITGATLAKAEGGPPEFAIQYTDFHPRNNLPFPTQIALTLPGAKLALTWRSDLETNPPSNPALFTFSPPRGARLVDLNPGDAPPNLNLPLKPTP
jgi:hypothetical protein